MKNAQCATDEMNQFQEDLLASVREIKVASTERELEADTELQRFGRTTILHIDIAIAFSGIADLLKAGEDALEWRQEYDSTSTQLPLGVRLHIDEIQSAFEYQLSEQKLRDIHESGVVRLYRYSVTMLLVSTVERLAKLMLAAVSTPKVHVQQIDSSSKDLIEKVAGKISLNMLPEPHRQTIGQFKRLVHVRNCLAHALGMANDYKHADEVKKDVEHLYGFSLTVSDSGEQVIVISRDALFDLTQKLQILCIALADGVSRVTSEQKKKVE